MKTLSLVLLLMASMAFVLLGCSDNSGPIAGPNDQAFSAGASPTALAKGAVERSVTGNANYWIAGKMGVLTINAKQYADKVIGRINLVTTAFNPTDSKMRGEVVAVTFYDDYSFLNGISGPTALFWWREEVAGWGLGKFFASFVVDKGQGSKAMDADWAGPVDGPYDAIIDLTPEEINTNWPGYFVPIAVGNVEVH